MAWLLRFNGSNDYFQTTPETIIPSNNSSFSLVFDIDYNGDANQTLLADPDGFNNSIYIVDASTIIARYGSASRTYNLNTPLSTGRQIIKIRRNGFSMAVYDENNNALSTPFNAGGTFQLNGFGVQFFSGSFQRQFTGDLYGIRIYSDFDETTLTHNYDPNATNGMGLVIQDTVGGNNGTLVNFPNDNSQWISIGGATYTITLDAGSYSFTGQDVTLLSNKLISLNSGIYTYTGQNVDLLAGRSINLNAGNYAYAGQNINLLASRLISLESGNYTYTGQDVTIVYNPSGGPTYLLAIDAGAYNYSGQDTQLIANRTLSIGSGDYAYTGSNLSLRANRSISIDSGAYVVTGNAVVLSANRAITLESGNYAYTGSPVTLSYSGEVIALVSGYSVNYAQDDATATYIDDYIKARFI